MSFEKPNSSPTPEQRKTLPYLEGMKIATQVLSTITKEAQEGLEVTQQLLDVLKLMREWCTQEQKQEKTNLPSVVEQALKDLPKSPENSETIADYLAEKFDGILESGQEAKKLLKQLVNDSTKIPATSKYKVIFHYYTQINQRVKTLLQDLLVKVQLELLVQKTEGTEKGSQQIEALISKIQNKIKSLQQNLDTVSGQLRFSNPDPSNTKSLGQEQDPSQMTINVKYEPVTEGETDDWNQPYRQQLPGWESPKAQVEWKGPNPIESQIYNAIDGFLEKGIEYNSPEAINTASQLAMREVGAIIALSKLPDSERVNLMIDAEQKINVLRLQRLIELWKRVTPSLLNPFKIAKRKKIKQKINELNIQLQTGIEQRILSLTSKKKYLEGKIRKIMMKNSFTLVSKQELKEEREDITNLQFAIQQIIDEIRRLQKESKKIAKQLSKTGDNTGQTSTAQEIRSLAPVGDNEVGEILGYEDGQVGNGNDYNNKVGEIPDYEVGDNNEGDQVSNDYESGKVDKILGYESGQARYELIHDLFDGKNILYAQVDESALPEGSDGYHVLGGLKINQQYEGTQVKINKFSDLIEVKDPSTETTYRIAISNDQENETLNVHKLDPDGNPVYVKNKNKLPFYAKISPNAVGRLYTVTLVSKGEKLEYKRTKEANTYDFS